MLAVGQARNADLEHKLLTRNSNFGAERATQPVAASRDALAITLRVTAMLGMILASWGLMHHYKGLGYDAQLYAFQALAKLQPVLNDDLFLLHASQDRYTIFSGFYAFFIEIFGLSNAAQILWGAFTITLLASGWYIIDRLISRRVAWLCVLLLVITLGHYGAYSVIHYSEDYLTARTAAESMVALSLALHIGGRRTLALVVSLFAMLFHPIMALPGLLMLICLSLPLRTCVVAATLGTLAILLAAIATRIFPAVSNLLTVIDSAWLYVVQERAQYLLLDLWSAPDWRLNARPFVSLSITYAAVSDPRVRRLCASAILIGAVGLAIAAIASFISPLAIVVQAQTWRLVWLTTFVSILFLAPTILSVWRDEKCGLLCALLLVMAWTYPILDNLLCALFALALWAARERLPQRSAVQLRWLAIVILIIDVVWMLGNGWTISSSPFDTGHDPLLLQTIKNFLGLQLPMFLLAWAAWSYVDRQRSPFSLAITCVVLAGSLYFILPASFKPADLLSVSSGPEEFADWQARIPEASSVAVITEDSSSFFVWFGLHRTNFLSEAQSAGVVFSRDTALEVARRSEILAPLMDPNWKILSSINEFERNPRKPSKPHVRPLTSQALVALCQEPLLGFVIAKEDVGFGSVRHTKPGAWKNWSLYDCRYVRSHEAQHATAS